MSHMCIDATTRAAFDLGFACVITSYSIHYTKLYDKENYLLPLTWGNRAEGSADAELKFQFSFKQQLYDGLYFAYTQKSFWRVLDGEDSRPFRETNYNPELFWRLLRTTPEGLSWGGDLGFEHESNGAREPTSRSWNRLYLAPTIGYT